MATGDNGKSAGLRQLQEQEAMARRRRMVQRRMVKNAGRGRYRMGEARRNGADEERRSWQVQDAMGEEAEERWGSGRDTGEATGEATKNGEREERMLGCCR
jgi:hypothetical protein